MEFDEHQFVSLMGREVYHLLRERGQYTLCGYDLRRIFPSRITYHPASFTRKKMQEFRFHGERLRPCERCQDIQIMHFYD